MLPNDLQNYEIVHSQTLKKAIRSIGKPIIFNTFFSIWIPD